MGLYLIAFSCDLAATEQALPTASEVMYSSLWALRAVAEKLALSHLQWLNTSLATSANRCLRVLPFVHHNCRTPTSA